MAVCGTGAGSGGYPLQRYHSTALAALALLLVTVFSPEVALGQSDRVTDEQIQAAIDRGVEALLAAQKDNGWWSDSGSYTLSSHVYAGGNEVCAMLALAYAGVPMTNEKMQKGFDELLKFDMLQTYNSAFRLMVITKLYNKLDRDRQAAALRVAMRDASFIVSLQRENGGWGYPAYEKGSDPPKRVAKRKDTWWDFSNTQMAILGLSEANKLRRIEIPRQVWMKAQELFVSNQLKDGGWNYGHEFGRKNIRDSSYGSMTAAAVASLMLTRDNLFPGLGCPCTGDESRGRLVELDASLERGYEWLGEHFAANKHPAAAGGETTIARWIPYWLYSCERVGLAGGMKYFGGHDWYAEGAQWFLKKQNSRTGMWGTIDDTSYAICFLVKGRAPILFNKLKFDGVWNSHPQDLSNLTDYIGQQKEQLMQWQVITLEAPVSEWHDAPILYISAESAIEFSDEDKAKLRQFTDNGGTIFYESSCGNRAATVAWRSLIAEVWPQYELQRLAADHPLFSSDKRLTRRPPNLLGMSDSVRTFMFVTFDDLSCVWAGRQVGVQQQATFDLGMNMYTYATDRRPLRARLASAFPEERYAEAAPQVGHNRQMKMARLKHGGDWHAGDNYATLQKLSDFVKQNGGLQLDVADAVAPSELAGDVTLAYLTGRRGLRLTDAETKALKDYLDKGGMLLADATLGSREFDADFRKAVAALGLELRAIAAGHSLLSGELDGANGYEISLVDFKFNLRRERIGRSEPELYLLTRGERIVGLYSPFDLMYSQTGFDAFDSRGYEKDDARVILTNFLLMMSAKPEATSSAEDNKPEETTDETD